MSLEKGTGLLKTAIAFWKQLYRFLTRAWPRIFVCLTVANLYPKLFRLQTAAEEFWRNTALLHAMVEKNELSGAYARWHLAAAMVTAGPALSRESGIPQLSQRISDRFVAELHHFLEASQEWGRQSPVNRQFVQSIQAGDIEKAFCHLALIGYCRVHGILNQSRNLRWSIFWSEAWIRFDHNRSSQKGLPAKKKCTLMLF
jgi:hypothetical protein